jgi:glycine/serine hydroxymethyltransferase
MEEVRLVQDTSQIMGFDIEQSGYQYNPRMSIQQNMLRSVIWVEVTQSQMLIDSAEIEEIARRMEKNKDVIE